ncbi:AAA family ATPase [Nocardia sp. NPDC052566]|uniref:AAA family ATPase n=1 Tax=Nocardia sp. NPDC052566 TaxID=3364330 RepID=UPI0037C6101D
MSAWPIFHGTAVPHDGIEQLPPPPNWRTFAGAPVQPPPPATDPETAASVARRIGIGDTHPRPTGHELRLINAALFLRRPLLVTGRPGSGKSTLATTVATELGLGPVLTWPITSRSTLRDGLYRYDPIGRLREENLRQARARAAEQSGAAIPADEDDIGRHIRLGPLGTALLPYDRPRVLLIDEIDKSDIDLPNDLLNVFEDGTYEIDELTRLPAEQAEISVRTADADGQAMIQRGRVLCRAFPFVVLTSNGEREFPAAFLRRCLRLDLRQPDRAQLAAMVAAHLGPEAVATAQPYIRDFLAKRTLSEIATDQLLNVVYLAMSGQHDSFTEVVAAVLRPLSEAGTE